VAVKENAIGKYSPCKREAPGIGVDPATILGVALEAEGVRDGDSRAGGAILHKIRRCSLLIRSPNELELVPCRSLVQSAVFLFLLRIRPSPVWSCSQIQNTLSICQSVYSEKVVERFS